MDPVFSSALRDALVAHVESTARRRRRWRWKVGLGVLTGTGVLAGGVAVATTLLSAPGATVNIALSTESPVHDEEHRLAVRTKDLEVVQDLSNAGPYEVANFERDRERLVPVFDPPIEKEVAVGVWDLFVDRLEQHQLVEYRVVVVRWDVPTGEEDQPLEIDFGDALKAIVLGEQYTDDVRPLLGGRIGVDVLRCRWGDGVPILASG